MNLHVFNDNYGFFPNCAEVKIRELYPSCNLVINLTISPTLPNHSIQSIPPDARSIKEYVAQLPLLQKIILHPLNYETAYFLLEVKKRYPSVKVYWVCWSYEIYNYHFTADRIYLPYALHIVQKDIKSRMKTYIKKSFVGEILSPLFPLKSFRNLKKAYAMVDFFASFLEEDYYVAKSISDNDSMQYLPFAYLSIEQIIDLNLTHDTDGNTIMLGHASSLESNHYEMITDFSKLDIKKKILIPLAYGNEQYRNDISQYAKESLKGPLEIMTEKLPAEEYYKKLREVKHAIFNLRVQQGLGNLLGLAYMGAKIYLREETTTYQQFKKWGLWVYNYDDIPHEIHNGLTDAQLNLNKTIILNLFNKNKVSLHWTPLLKN